MENENYFNTENEFDSSMSELEYQAELERQAEDEFFDYIDKMVIEYEEGIRTGKYPPPDTSYNPKKGLQKYFKTMSCF